MDTLSLAKGQQGTRSKVRQPEPVRGRLLAPAERPPSPPRLQEYQRSKGIRRPVEVETRTLAELKEVRALAHT